MFDRIASLGFAALGLISSTLALTCCSAIIPPPQGRAGDVWSAPPTPLPPSPIPPTQPRSVPAASSPYRVPAGLGPIEFFAQFDERGDLAAAKGTARTLRWPDSVHIDRTSTLIAYEWRPEDGREKEIDPRTGVARGPILKPTLAEMTTSENLIRYLDSMDRWLDVWVPRNFAGVVCIDIETYGLKTDDFHMSDTERSKLRELHPGKTHDQQMAMFVRRTIDRCKVLRPRVASWGWFSLGGMHPAFTVWNPDKKDNMRTQALRDAHVLALPDVAMPATYYIPVFEGHPQERRKAWADCVEHLKLGYSPERLRDGYCYVNAQHNFPKNPLDGQILTRPQFDECIQAGLDLGMRRFIVWASINGPAERDRLQGFIDDVLTPAARDLGVGPDPR